MTSDWQPFAQGYPHSMKIPVGPCKIPSTHNHSKQINSMQITHNVENYFAQVVPHKHLRINNCPCHYRRNNMFWWSLIFFLPFRFLSIPSQAKTTHSRIDPFTPTTEQTWGLATFHTSLLHSTKLAKTFPNIHPNSKSPRPTICAQARIPRVARGLAAQLRLWWQPNATTLIFCGPTLQIS